MKKHKNNHSQILAELLHKFARSEIRAAHREMMDSVKNNDAKKEAYIKALEYVGISCSRDISECTVFGDPNEVILEGKKS